jgi:hypothetical protein
MFFQQPDSNMDALLHLLRTIADKSSDEVDTILKVHHQGRTVMTTVDSIFKDKENLVRYSRLYIFDVFQSTRLFKPTYVYAWQSCAQPVSGTWCLSSTENMLIDFIKAG